MSRPTQPPSPELLRGLNSIRFLCALWVVLGHYRSPRLPAALDPHTSLGWMLHGLYANAWCAPAAVIVFFVLSGFLIHWPQVGKVGPLPLREFYARRFLRLCLPLAAALLLAYLVGEPLFARSDAILWSLLAEGIYYALYPLLRQWSRWMGWNGLLGLAFFLALGVILTNPTAGSYPSYGSGLNWLLGLPCWLLGCRLAETVRARMAQEPSGVTSAPWGWRWGILMGSIGCSVLRFHSPVGYPWTLNLFALAVAAWLGREIIYYKWNRPIPWLEQAGLASYSLYLVHLPAQTLWVHLPSRPGPILDWLGRILFALLLAYLFHRVVEKPAHALARRVGNRWRRPTLPASRIEPVEPTVVV